MEDLVNQSLGIVEAPAKVTQSSATGSADRLDYYKILNIQPNATRMQIREAYMRLKSAFGDENQALYSIVSEDEARRNVAAVEEAYFTLQDDLKRERYDRDLQSGFRYRRTGASASEVAEDRPATTGFTGLGPSGNVPIIPTIANNAADPTMKAAVASMILEGDPADGDLLKRIREKVAVTLEEMQDRTKILSDYITAIEENRFERLPPTVYVKGFLRSYLKYLSINDADKIVNAYAARLDDWRATKKN